MQCNCHPLSALAVDKHKRLRCLSHAFVHVAAGLSFALKASYTKFPSLSSWLFDAMTTSLQMIQCSATAIPFPHLQWINTLDCVAFHMLLCMLQQGLSFALKASYTKYPSLSSWFFDTMKTSLQMIQYSATAPLSALTVDKRNGFRVCHMLFVEGSLCLSTSVRVLEVKSAMRALLQWQGNSKSCLTTPVRVLEVKSSIPALLQVAR